MISDWQSSIVSADLADWVTVAGCLPAAILSARAARHAGSRHLSRDSVFWRLTAGLLVFFAMNELLDLHTHLTEVGRAYAKANGWYGERRRVQALFIVGLGVVALCAGVAMLWLTRRAHTAVRLATAGLAFIGLFVLMRAASFHHFGDILNRGAPDLTWGSLQEVVGILIVGAAAMFYTGKPRRASDTDNLRSTSRRS